MAVLSSGLAAVLAMAMATPTPTATTPTAVVSPPTPPVPAQVGYAPGYRAPSSPRATGRRGNTVLDRPLNKGVIGVAAAVRMGVELGSGSVFLRPPLGFGFGFDFRYHRLRIGPMRFGFEFQAGHTRFPTYTRFQLPSADADGEGTVRRQTLLAHTDITLGPSFQAPIGPVFLEFGAAGGIIISDFTRAVSHDPLDDQELVGYSPAVRGDIGLGIPIVRNQGLRLGVNFQKMFSSEQIISDPTVPDATPDSVVFDMYLDITFAYQAWF